MSIIIVTWNGLHHLKTFLPYVCEYTGDDTEIIVADNNSDDGTADWLAQNYPDCIHHKLDDNYGYCGGNNRGANVAQGEFLLFLNNDVQVTSNWLTPLISHLDENPDSAAIQPKLRDFTNRDYFEYAGASGGFLDYYGYPFCRGRILETIERDSGQYDENVPIHWASGAALMIRKSLFDKLGGFDERFEFHMEEIDLCWRLRNRGYKIEVLPQSVVYHLGGGSLASGSYRKWYYNYRNNLSMLLKNLPEYTVLSRIITRLCLDGLAGIYALFRLRPSETLAIIHAHFGFYRRLPSFLKSRKAELQSTSKGNRADGKPISIIWRYFVRRQKKFSDLDQVR